MNTTTRDAVSDERSRVLEPEDVYCLAPTPRWTGWEAGQV